VAEKEAAKKKARFQKRALRFILTLWALRRYQKAFAGSNFHHDGFHLASLFDLYGQKFLTGLGVDTDGPRDRVGLRGNK